MKPTHHTSERLRDRRRAFFTLPSNDLLRFVELNIASRFPSSLGVLVYLEVNPETALCSALFRDRGVLL